MRRIQGSITIFLSLILLSILALICVCLESARAARASGVRTDVCGLVAAIGSGRIRPDSVGAVRSVLLLGQ